MNQPIDRSPVTVTAPEPAPVDRVPAPQREISRLRRFVLGSVSVFLGLFLSFVILEFGLATFYYSNGEEIERYTFDKELGWRFKPGQYVIKPPGSLLKYKISINSLGLRYRELGPRPEGTKRIIVLGDSFTFGENVRDEALFSTQLERRLNDRPAVSGLKYEVVNTGVPGYGNAQELLLTRRLASAGVVGDVYILNVFTNDILDNLCMNYGDRSRNAVQPGFVLENGQLIFKYKPENVSRDQGNLVAVRRGFNLKLVSVVKNNLQSIAQTKPGLTKLAGSLGFNINVQRMPGIINAWYDDEVLASGVPLMKALIGEINTTVRSHNGTLIVTLIPSPMLVYSETYDQIIKKSFPDDPQAKQFLADPARAQRIISQMCKELNLPLLDMLPILQANRNRSFYLPADGHFNEAGHAIFAASLEKFVRENMPRQ